MLVFYACPCGAAFKVSKTDEDLHLLSLRMRCPDESCVRGMFEIQDNDDDGVLITAKELFALCSGRGTPKERQCSPERLRELLVGGHIKELEVEASSADPNRSLVSKMLVGIDFGDPSKAVVVHFAMSSKGATIYKVTDL